MQNYIIPKLSIQKGRTIWLGMLEDVNAQQLMHSAVISVVAKLVLLVVLLCWVLFFSWSQTSWLGLIISYVALSFVLTQFAFLGHDAGHGTLHAKPTLNRVLGQFCMTIVTGLAFDEWIDRHRAHHRFCQIDGQDPDMDVAHLVALTPAAFAKKGRVERFFLKFQHLFIWALSLFFGHSQRHLSQLGVLKDLQRYRLDAVILVLHFSLWFGLPCLVFNVPFSFALFSYVIPLFILGPHFAAIFWVNHIGMPLIKNADDFSFFEHQYMTSRSISNPSKWNWLFGGLNFQIEHHLFPQVPSHKLVLVQPIVKQHALAHRLTYNEQTWQQAIRDISKHLHVISR
jgi:fatty acid desaturase